MQNNNKTEPKVSVIIPCYNSEITIQSTLESLENQVYRNFEVILINDGSKDNTETILKEYILKSNLNIKYIKQENKGVSIARNKGISRAEGQYILFLDSDDIYNIEFIKILVENIEKQEVDVAYCVYSRNIDFVRDYRAKKIDIKFLKQQQLLENFMYRKGPCGFFTYIYKKSIINMNDIRFSQEISYGEDLEFTWKYLSECKSGIFIELPLYGYLDNINSAINNINFKMIDVLKVIKNMENYFLQRNNQFYNKFKVYMYPRTMWSILKDFSINDDLYRNIIKEYDVKKIIKQLLFQRCNTIIKFTIILFFIHPNLFQLFFKLMSKLKSLKMRFYM